MHTGNYRRCRNSLPNSIRRHHAAMTTPFKNCLAFSSWRSAQFPLGYCPTHVRPLRLTSLKRFLVAETSVVIFFCPPPLLSSLSPSIALISFFFPFINTFRAVRAWLGIPDRCFSLEYKRDGNHEGLYGDGIKAYSTRESSRKRKSWLAYSRWTKANRRPRHWVKVNNSRFSLCDSQATGVAFRRSATLNQRQFIDNTPGNWRDDGYSE